MRRIGHSLGLFGMFLVLVGVATPAVARDYYGAIAYSPDMRAYGYSYDSRSRAHAEKTAMARCRSYGGGCRVVTWFRNACGALAIGDDGGYGGAWAGSRAAAERSALRTCAGSSSDCTVVRWACTTR